MSLILQLNIIESAVMFMLSKALIEINESKRIFIVILIISSNNLVNHTSWSSSHHFEVFFIS